MSQSPNEPRVIRIKMFDEERKVLSSEDEITQSSVKSLFLLPNDAIVRLSYEMNGVKFGCKTRNTPEPCFLLPDGWLNIEFLLESSVLSRGASFLDIKEGAEPIYVTVKDCEDGELLELPCNPDKTLSLTTLSYSFPGATGLKFKNPMTGLSRAVMLNLSGQLFLCPAGGWKDHVFTAVFPPRAQENVPTNVPLDLVVMEDLVQRVENIESHFQRSLQPETPDSKSKVKECVPIEVNDYVRRLQKYLFFEKFGDDQKSCFTVITPHHAVSYYHGHHKDWRPWPSENHTRVTICNQDGIEFETKVVLCHRKLNYVVVHSEQQLVAEPPIVAYPRHRERYILLGCPKGSSDEALEGIFPSISTDYIFHLHGSSRSRKGYSGGPAFSYEEDLLGIDVTNESSPEFVGLSTQNTLGGLVDEANHTFPFVSMVVPAYSVACEFEGCKFA